MEICKKIKSHGSQAICFFYYTGYLRLFKHVLFVVEAVRNVS